MRNSSPAFLDASGWIASLNRDDGLHKQALQVLARLRQGQCRVWTTDWIIAETGNGLARTRARQQFALAVRRAFTSPFVSVVRVDEMILRDSLNLYEQVADKTWGIVDCASIVIMRREGIRHVISGDHHFEQAGFHCLLPTT